MSDPNLFVDVQYRGDAPYGEKTVDTGRFGPFTDRTTVEDLVLTLVSRGDVLSATIREVGENMRIVERKSLEELKKMTPEEYEAYISMALNNET